MKKFAVILLSVATALTLVGCDLDLDESYVEDSSITIESSVISEDETSVDDSLASAEVNDEESKPSEEVDVPVEEELPWGEFVFVSNDIDGNTVTADMIKGAKLVMVNFWEPWCGPCVGEMPDLEKLYEAYKDQGLLILGVYSSYDMDDEVHAILDDCGTTYPIIHTCADFDKYQTGYVPTTIFTDGRGNVLTDEPYIGSNSYANWESIILSYLN